MARQTITPIVAPGRYPTDGVEGTPTVAIVADKEQFALTGKEILIAYNIDATDPSTVTITSVADPKTGRLGHITTDSIPAGKFHVYGPFAQEGWMQTDGMLYFEASSTDIIYFVIRIPA